MKEISDAKMLNNLCSKVIIGSMFLVCAVQTNSCSVDYKHKKQHTVEKTVESLVVDGVEQVQKADSNEFKLYGLASQGIRDVAYLIHISDADFGHTVETKRVEVVDHKFEFTSNYSEPRVATFQAIFDDGTICNSTVPVMIVPGETAKLKVKNGTFELSGGSDFYTQYGDANDFYRNNNYVNEEMFRGYLTEHSSDEGAIMAFIYSQFLPGNEIVKIVSPDVKTGRFSRLFETGHYGSGYTQSFHTPKNVGIEKVGENPGQCVLKGKVSHGIHDVGYIIRVYDKNFENIEDVKEVKAENGTFEAAFSYKEPRLAIFTAVFDDGSICNASISLLLMPNETGTMKVMNGTYELSGESGFYKEYGDAIDLRENASRYYTAKERHQMIEDYFIQHASEEGCVAAYIDECILPVPQILKYASESVTKGRLKTMFDTGHISGGFRQIINVK